MSKHIFRAKLDGIGEQEEYLNYMATAGYNLVSVGLAFYKFKKTEKQNKKYFVDKWTEFGEDAFVKNLEDKGMKLIDRCGNCFYFDAAGAKTETSKNFVEKNSALSAALYIFFALAALFLSGYSLFSEGEIRFISIGMIVFLGIFIAVTGALFYCKSKRHGKDEVGAKKAELVNFYTITAIPALLLSIKLTSLAIDGAMKLINAMI